MITNTELEKKGNLFPSKLVSYEQNGDSILFLSENGVHLIVTVLRDSMLRFRYATHGVFENDFSYAIDNDHSHGYSVLEIIEDETAIWIVTEQIKCRINRSDLKTAMFDIEDELILQDELGFHWEESFEFGGNYVKMSKSTVEGENFYGLGDKPTHFNLKGKRISNWNTDQYAFGRDLPELYKSIPFYIGLHHAKSYGIFFDNTFKTHFDFCHERRHVTSFWADGGEMNYYFIYGPKIAEVVTKYTNLTGRPELPPMWALGYHQSKWSYYPEAKVKELAASFRENKFPCDALYLDIDYMDGFRCFTWNKDYFPEPKRMVEELEEDGFKTVAIIDPGIKIDNTYEIFTDGLEKDYFCKRADGPYMRGKVWPGNCVFPDFTNPEVREWWADHYKTLIAEIGVKGVWNDMNEPAVMEVPGKTFPLDVRHDYDGNRCSHRKAHNIYGMQMARATYEGVKKYIFPKRPFTITRASYSGGQRYSSTWTGDNVATWEHLWLGNVQIQRLGMSGFSFAGTDIGGFADQPTGELFTRWIQLGVFHPFCRVHSSGDHGEQEPWYFGEEVLNITRKFVELRYQLLPYLYTAFYQYCEDNIPILKPLVYFDQEDIQTHYRSDEFIFGNHFLVCPIQEPNVQGRRMYIPRGRWYNFWNDAVIEGGKELWVDAPLDSMPIFVREGAIIPKYPVQQYVDEIQIEELRLDVYYKEGKQNSIYYEDDHDGYDYKMGLFNLRTFKLTGKEKEIIIQQHVAGTYKSSLKTMKICLHGLPFDIKSASVNNEDVTLESIGYNKAENFIVLNENFTDLRLVSE
ncbi:glycoside hydrolase family 31 protein [Zunongwangia sp. HGR-M22]|uniref:glycoside hydrolase family 31 protein n=1 Tax=Zunongwangia sp. HGR-M22 TaxID=3015168 RepID=UPI0022DE737F|nr:glycoside hydrolase family 31 protein [Zunongwangia sp. HGR-M22]WBL25180.1 glycoside hydrolase family 31 protein [Zunongwangia sp. HGR-M22]